MLKRDFRFPFFFSINFIFVVCVVNGLLFTLLRYIVRIIVCLIGVRFGKWIFQLILAALISRLGDCILMNGPADIVEFFCCIFSVVRMFLTFCGSRMAMVTSRNVSSLACSTFSNKKNENFPRTLYQQENQISFLDY